MHIVLQVLAASAQIEKAAHRLFRPHGLSAAQFNILNLLADQPDGLRASQLAEALIVDPSNVTGLVKRLKADRYLRSVDSPQDRRQHVVVLTDRGRARWQQAVRDYEQALAAIGTGLSARDLAAAGRILRHLQDRAQARG
ncbi:MAG: MarR family winged helix-turn-helix transcriptional regulator [Opitutales bacterium]